MSATDTYGRIVTASNSGSYTITDSTGVNLTIEAPSIAAAVTTANGMAPSNWTPPPTPNPTTISTSAFLNRFTPAEQNAVWSSAITTPAIGVGLQTGLSDGTVNLLSTVTVAWMAALVTAGAITSARSTVILTP